jgi:hypothetical protein
MPDGPQWAPAPWFPPHTPPSRGGWGYRLWGVEAVFWCPKWPVLLSQLFGGGLESHINPLKSVGTASGWCGVGHHHVFGSEVAGKAPTPARPSPAPGPPRYPPAMAAQQLAAGVFAALCPPPGWLAAGGITAQAHGPPQPHSHNWPAGCYCFSKVLLLCYYLLHITHARAPAFVFCWLLVRWLLSVIACAYCPGCRRLARRARRRPLVVGGGEWGATTYHTYHTPRAAWRWCVCICIWRACIWYLLQGSKEQLTPHRPLARGGGVTVAAVLYFYSAALSN